ncbi:MAG TPA: hypothetical protein VMW87_03620 [Spirochaetia bacterium]|nr:hypothetical protein [Spirochaetia bacterium]
MNAQQFPHLDRNRLRFKPLGDRMNKVRIVRDHVPVDATPALSEDAKQAAGQAALDIRRARERSASVILAFGAHTIKNGLSPVLIRLIEAGWVTHLATNGAGIIHDWEFAFQGESSEDVRKYIQEGQFGIWEETGFFLNLAINVGAYEGLGYGESVGALVSRQGLDIPAPEELVGVATGNMRSDPQLAASALDLLAIVESFGLKPGFLRVPHPSRGYGVQAAAFRLHVPFTGHPMFGHDIIYAHPMNQGSAIGRTAERDFLAFAHSVSGISNGVYLSVGSAVMSPMIFEKSMSMAQNLAIQNGGRIENHAIYVVDLSESRWDWQSNTEPPSTDPAYYLRYCKTFSRMGGRMKYVQADNRDFLLALSQDLTGSA